MEKRRKTIKVENEKLAQEYKGKNDGFDACIQQLEDDSMNMTNSIAAESFFKNTSIHGTNIAANLSRMYLDNVFYDIF